MEFIDILIPPTFPEKGAISFEPGPKGASRGLTESMLEVEKREDGGRWIKIPIFNGEEEWGEVSGGTSLGIITPWEEKGHFHEFEGQKDGGGPPTPAECFNESLTSSCLLYTSPSPRDATLSRMPSSA